MLALSDDSIIQSPYSFRFTHMDYEAVVSANIMTTNVKVMEGAFLEELPNGILFFPELDIITDSLVE